LVRAISAVSRRDMPGSGYIEEKYIMKMLYAFVLCVLSLPAQGADQAERLSGQHNNLAVRSDGSNAPIVRKGSTCPPGYFRSGEYCQPGAGYKGPAISRQGSVCPPGYFRSGEYCRPRAGHKKPAISRKGSVCPPGYHRNGDYCVK